MENKEIKTKKQFSQLAAYSPVSHNVQVCRALYKPGLCEGESVWVRRTNGSLDRQVGVDFSWSALVYRALHSAGAADVHKTQSALYNESHSQHPESAHNVS